MRLRAGMVAAMVVAASGASAADLGSPRLPVAGAVTAAATTWTGFYGGVHLGYGWGQQRVADGNPAVFYTVNPRGVFGGFQVGYNHQINQFVVGVEGDLSLGSVSQRRPNPGALAIEEVAKTTNVFASARLRGGVAFGDALLYATGGLGYASSRDTNYQGGVVFGPGLRNDRIGWVAGAGIEYAVNANLSVKVEYLRYDFGSWRRTGTVFWGIGDDFFRASMDTVKVGLNYRFSTGPSAVVARY